MQQIKLVCDQKIQLYGWIALLAIRSLVSSAGIKTCLQLEPTTSDTFAMPTYISVSPEEWLWLLKMGLNEQKTMVSSDGVFSLGWHFSDWKDKESIRFTGFSPLLAPIEGARGATLAARYCRNRHNSTISSEITTFSLNGQCMANDRFRHPLADPQHILSSLEYGVQLNVEGLCESIKELCDQNESFDPRLQSPDNDELIISLSTESFKPYIGAISNTSEANNTPHLAPIFTLGKETLSIERHGRTSTNNFHVPLKVLDSIFCSTTNYHQMTSHSLSLSLPATMLVTADAGVSVLRQYMQQISNMMPTEKGWLVHTRGAMLDNFRHIDESCRASAMLPFYLAKSTTVVSPILESIMQCFVGSGTIDETEYPLFDSAIVENMLRVFDYLPESESPLAQLMPDDKLENMINQIRKKMAQVALTLPSHKEYLTRYLSEYL